MRDHVLAIAVLACACGCLLMGGCGGGGGGDEAANGEFQLTVVFPPLSEAEVQPAVIYSNTQSITADLQDQTTGANVVPRATLNRPSPAGGEVTATITAIPAGTWLLVVQGWSGLDGTGSLLSTVSDTATIQIAQTTTKRVVMSGYPFALTLAASANPVLIDLTTIVVATPKDADGATLLGAYQYEWSSDAPAIASIRTPGGTGSAETFQGVSRGTCSVKAKLIHDDPEAGQADVEGTLTLTVNPNVDAVTMLPDTMSMPSNTNADATATARYKGAVVPDVAFTFQSSTPAVATVTKTGQNTCRVSAVAGGYATITASQPYTTTTGTIAVTVPEGNLDVIIQATQE